VLALSTSAAPAASGGAEGVSASLAPATAPRVLQIRAKELWTAGGTRIADGLLVVAEGRIRAVGKAAEIDPAQALVVHDGVVTAGLVGCYARSGTAGELQDDTRTVLASADARHAFDPRSREVERALQAGITALSIVPGPGNLVGGLACVVKTSGGRVLKPEAALALSLTNTALGRSTAQGGFFFGQAEAGRDAGAGDAAGELFAEPDGGPESSGWSTRGTRAPTSYAGALATLRRLFARDAGVFARARRGDLPVTIEAWDRHEVLRATALARELELAGAIRGAPLAGDPEVVAALKASGLGVIVGPYSAAQTTRSLASLAALAAAGVPVAFALDAPAHSPLDLRISAARAVRAGAPREAAWKALTEDAARLAGVADAAGSLAVGRDADFVLWSGDPLDLTSRPVAVYVDGQLAWSEAKDH
jgi:imidazolonepropionase-like amidohydrolase